MATVGEVGYLEWEWWPSTPPKSRSKSTLVVSISSTAGWQRPPPRFLSDLSLFLTGISISTAKTAAIPPKSSTFRAKLGLSYMKFQQAWKEIRRLIYFALKRRSREFHNYGKRPMALLLTLWMALDNMEVKMKRVKSLRSPLKY
ncbi:hypothetical protein CRG98_008531 [Punica granatum]|uniref:Uncharacterized protein n=1 Tax=Punica granatum TaxID=22663 RepID=A0A2I0KT95_PUNGR|nr:hypothetical protein CRG98_008531 [Punica granatum]